MLCGPRRGKRSISPSRRFFVPMGSGLRMTAGSAHDSPAGGPCVLAGVDQRAEEDAHGFGRRQRHPGPGSPFADVDGIHRRAEHGEHILVGPVVARRQHEVERAEPLFDQAVLSPRCIVARRGGEPPHVASFVFGLRPSVRNDARRDARSTGAIGTQIGTRAGHKGTSLSMLVQPTLSRAEQNGTRHGSRGCRLSRWPFRHQSGHITSPHESAGW